MKMTKNEYSVPKMELITVSAEDIIVTSGGFYGAEDNFSTPTYIDDLNQNI